MAILGYTEDHSVIGERLHFTDLKDMIGEKVVTTCGNWYKVVKITEYYEECEKIYKRVRELPASDIGYGEYVNSYIHDVCGIGECMDCYEVAYICDRVRYSDRDSDNTGGCTACEAYCDQGRYQPITSDLQKFYRYVNEQPDNHKGEQISIFDLL